jgi:hypothetical protein
MPRGHPQWLSHTVSRVTTPHDPQRQGRPDQGPYGGQQGPYGPPQSQPPGPYGPPYGGPEQYGPPPGQYGQQGPYGPPAQYGGPQQFDQEPAQQPFTYNPYGAAPAPAGIRQEDLAPVGRPALLIVAFIMLFIATLPFLVGAAMAMLAPPSPTDIPALANNPRVIQAGGTPEMLTTLFRIGGAIVLVIAAAYLMFALFALSGKNWARIIVTILTTIFVALLVLGTPFSSLSGAGLGFFVGIIALSIGGIVLMFLPASRRYFARR